jgi:hypothetical protein
MTRTSRGLRPRSSGPQGPGPQLMRILPVPGAVPHRLMIGNLLESRRDHPGDPWRSRSPGWSTAEWRANMTLRHCWFRIVLHLVGIIRRPRNFFWHARSILRELYGRSPKA